jgi:hypothetical protein
LNTPQVLQQFQKLCQAIDEREVMLLECESLPEGEKAVFVCAVRQINDQLRELVPVARLLDAAFGALVLPEPSTAAAWSPEQN